MAVDTFKRRKSAHIDGRTALRGYLLIALGGSAARLVRTMDEEEYGGNALQERVVAHRVEAVDAAVQPVVLRAAPVGPHDGQLHLAKLAEERLGVWKHVPQHIVRCASL